MSDSKRTPAQNGRILLRAERKARQLSNRHKDNTYEVKDGQCILVKGRHPHKVSKKVPKQA